MAAGGVTFVGTTGEDYAVPFLNCIALDTDDPTEINIGLDFLRKHPDIVERMRAGAQETAESFSWKNVVEDNLLGKLRYVALRQLVTPPGKSEVTPSAPAPAGPGAPAAGGASPKAPGGEAAPGGAGATAAQTAPGGAKARPAGQNAETAAKAPAADESTPEAGDESLPYGGGSVSRRPSIKPQTSAT